MNSYMTPTPVHAVFPAGSTWDLWVASRTPGPQLAHDVAFMELFKFPPS